MQVVIDTNVLVGELIRERGRRLLSHAALDLFITEAAWAEVEHELPRRLVRLVDQGRLTANGAARLERAIYSLAGTRLLILPALLYELWEMVARSRIPRDPTDWPTVAAALATGGAIWTTDCDFIGCGLPTWTTDTLLAALPVRAA